MSQTSSSSPANASAASESKPPATYDDLKALFVNCTLKLSSQDQSSHTDRLLEVSQAIMRSQGVSIDTLRLVDHDVAFGVQPDMTEHGAPTDEWPSLWPRVRDADILIIGTPIWLGMRSSVCSQFIERLYAHSAEQNERGQYVYYGKVGGCIVTGNEDGIKHVGMGVLYCLQHIGYAVPPQADAGWIGEAGPGPSYGDEIDGQNVPAGYDNAFTQRNTTFMTWNLLHFARLLKDRGGVPAYGNVVPDWQAGQRFGHPHPETFKVTSR